jgi:hypothetical protein
MCHQYISGPLDFGLVSHTLSLSPVYSPQCEGCEYAGCIWIAVVIVVPMVATAADSSSTEKTMILLISNYKDRKYSSSTFYRLFTLFLYVIRDNCQIIS